MTVRPPTDEEREALRDGSLTQDDLIGRLTDSGEANAPAEPAETAESESDASDYQKQLSELIAQVYVLREEYLGALEAMEADARAEYNALTEDVYKRQELGMDLLHLPNMQEARK